MRITRIDARLYMRKIYITYTLAFRHSIVVTRNVSSKSGAIGVF
ncbi:hypothetical protein [Hydrococcus rivularis]|nr:hypothetical protein [Hydrococcus rivularis]